MLEEVIFWTDAFRKSRLDETAEAEKDEVLDGYETAFLLLNAIGVRANRNGIRTFIDEWANPTTNKALAFDKHAISDLEVTLEQRPKNSELNIVAIVFGTTGRIFRNEVQVSHLGLNSTRDFLPHVQIVPALMNMIEIQSTLTTSTFAEETENVLQNARKKTEFWLSKISETGEQQIEVMTKNVISEVDAKKASTLRDIENNSKKHLENVKNELKENFILQDAMTLWEDKAKRHMNFFYFGAFIFSATIIVAVVGLLWHWTPVTLAVKSLVPEGQSIALGNLVLVTVPVLACAWVLRLLSRFTLQNLNLADDALQRSVMAKTFIRLSGEGKVEEDTDRTIMLNALFRPVPGAKEQDLQPPNLSDFISKPN
ncbi:MAG: DUF6161 domain-containing protein [Roseibium sp.]|uniref:DUF6161 domain-containing protein n=1 Tax=Roseibium sp. TaxID=1936156 RepID=UPI003D9C13A3